MCPPQSRRDAGPGRQACCLGAQQLGHAHPGFGGPAGEPGVYLVVQVANLHSLRQEFTVSCVRAPQHAPHRLDLTSHDALFQRARVGVPRSYPSTLTLAVSSGR